MPVEAAKNPRILLVEDDATSAAFLAAAVEALPATVDVAGSLAAAREAMAIHDYQLWLVDANLPDGTGAELLKSRRSQGGCTPAIAHTAAHERSVRDALIAAGFDQVLVKPLATAQLQTALRRALGIAREVAVAPPAPATPGHASPVWDDASASAALKGSLANVRALRNLCLGELPRARDDVVAAVARGNMDALHGILHKLRASCGFVGARRLDDAVRSLQDAPGSAVALNRFNAAVHDTLVEETVNLVAASGRPVVNGVVVEGTVVERTIVERTIVERTIVEDTIVEDTVVEGTIVEDTVIEDARVLGVSPQDDPSTA